VAPHTRLYVALTVLVALAGVLLFDLEQRIT
jgi:hypothetical protein